MAELTEHSFLRSKETDYHTSSSYLTLTDSTLHVSSSSSCGVCVSVLSAVAAVCVVAGLRGATGAVTGAVIGAGAGTGAGAEAGAAACVVDEAGIVPEAGTWSVAVVAAVGALDAIKSSADASSDSSSASPWRAACAKRCPGTVVVAASSWAAVAGSGFC
eukprot:COSAG05_NODE_2407_length_3100_cov_5.011996_2_plen_159_part_01